MMGSCLKGIIAALVVVGLDAAQAQNSLTPETEPQEWRQLSPDSRDEMRRQYLDSLAPNERKKLRSLVKRFNSMSPAKKQELCRRFRKDRGYLPPACQHLF